MKTLFADKRILIAAVIPAIFCLVIILSYGVNLPFLDETAYPTLVHMVKKGNFYTPVLWSLHNEHLILLPRLVAIPLLLITNYDSRALMVFSWICVLVLFVCAIRLARQAEGSSGLMAGTVFIAGCFLFSPVNEATFLDGFQYSLSLPNALTAIALVLLSTAAGGISRVAMAAMCLVAAGLCALSGLVGWPVAILLAFLVNSGSRRWWGVVILGIGALISYRINLVGLRNPQPAADPSYAWKHPEEGLRFFTTLVGAPLAHGWPLEAETIALWLGGFALVAGAVIVCRIAYERDRVSYGLAALMVYSFVFSAAVASGRANWGTHTAVGSSRYMCGSTIAWCAMVLYLGVKASRGYEWVGRAGLAIGLGVLVLSLNTYAALREIAKTSSARSFTARVAPFVEMLSDETDGTPISPLWACFPLPAKGSGLTVRGTMRLLQEAQLRPPAIQAPFVADPPAYYGEILSMGGARTVRAGEELMIQGTAGKPETRECADLIGITLTVPAKKFFTFVPGCTEETPNTGAVHTQGEFNHAGWRITIPANQLPKGPLEINAWVFDPAMGRFAALRRERLEQIVVE